MDYGRATQSISVLEQILGCYGDFDWPRPGGRDRANDELVPGDQVTGAPRPGEGGPQLNPDPAEEERVGDGDRDRAQQHHAAPVEVRAGHLDGFCPEVPEEGLCAAVVDVRVGDHRCATIEHDPVQPREDDDVGDPVVLPVDLDGRAGQVGAGVRACEPTPASTQRASA